MYIQRLIPTMIPFISKLVLKEENVPQITFKIAFQVLNK